MSQTRGGTRIRLSQVMPGIQPVLGTVHQLAGSQAFPAPAGHLGEGSGHWPATQLLRQDSGAKGMTKSVLGAGIPGTVRVGLLRDVVRTLGEARQAIPFVRDRLC